MLAYPVLYGGFGLLLAILATTTEATLQQSHSSHLIRRQAPAAPAPAPAAPAPAAPAPAAASPAPAAPAAPAAPSPAAPPAAPSPAAPSPSPSPSPSPIAPPPPANTSPTKPPAATTIAQPTTNAAPAGPAGPTSSILIKPSTSSSATDSSPSATINGGGADLSNGGTGNGTSTGASAASKSASPPSGLSFPTMMVIIIIAVAVLIAAIGLYLFRKFGQISPSRVFRQRLKATDNESHYGSAPPPPHYPNLSISHAPSIASLNSHIPPNAKSSAKRPPLEMSDIYSTIPHVGAGGQQYRHQYGGYIHSDDQVSNVQFIRE